MKDVEAETEAVPPFSSHAPCSGAIVGEAQGMFVLALQSTADAEKVREEDTALKPVSEVEVLFSVTPSSP